MARKPSRLLPLYWKNHDPSPVCGDQSVMPHGSPTSGRVFPWENLKAGIGPLQGVDVVEARAGRLGGLHPLQGNRGKGKRQGAKGERES